MKKILDKWLLHIAFILSLIVYSFWKYIKDYTDIQIFFVGVAFFIMMLAYQLYKDNKKSFIRFLIFELSVANVIKELFLDPGKLTLEEALLIVIIPFIWYLRKNYDEYNRILERDKCGYWRSYFVHCREKIYKIYRKKTTS